MRADECPGRSLHEYSACPPCGNLAGRPGEQPEDMYENRRAEASIARCITAALIHDGKILLVERTPHRKVYPAVWDLPGGHIEGEESPEKGLRREAREELGIEIESFHLLGQVP